MKKIILFSAVLAVAILISSFAIVSVNIEKLTMNMTMRELKEGKSYTVKAEIYYNKNGKLVSHFTEPVNYFLITSSTGSYQIYNPTDNSVSKGINPLFGSNQTQLHYFLGSSQNDLGLKDIGFSLASSKIESGLIIKEYIPNANMGGDTKLIELVNDKDKPIFMGAKDEKGEYIRKTYYYNYKKVGDKNFPTSITEISFNSPTDSIISKINYNNIRINNEINSTIVDFVIPDNAKLNLNN